QIFLPVLLVLCTITGVKANNIRVEGKTRVVSIVSDTAIVEVTLRWDNSWRDDFNWDAAWVFFKFKKRGLENPWQHAYLSSSGHVLSTATGNEGGGYTYMVGANAGKVNGLYVMRNGISEGNVSVRLQAKWPLNGTGLTKSDFGNALNEIYVAVHAIEMVYVPYGAYYLGDASSYKSFAVGDTAAVVIDSENALTLSAKNGMPNVSLAASYPKGYAGFYVMKYETSQEQYVEFLNSLTLDQQKARVANNNFSTMKRGDYVFGDIAQPSCRNGIVFIEQRKANTPVVFGNNLNPANDLFSTDDGQTLACNYMSIEDMIAYCSWSGLRPMSELEYEKACRRFYPQVPDKGEYAWNTNNGVNRLNGLGDLNYRGDQREQALSYLKNVNSGTTNSINGPVRCGLFATSATNQTQAGATYWGVMEMSGNLKELCANVNYSNLNGGSCGAGVYNPTLWNASTSYYGVRGGGFNSADDLLRTSDRTEAMNYFTSITQRDSTVGFRGVYSLSGIKIDGGEIKMSQDTACWGETDVLNVVAASCPDFPDVRFQYNWYVKKPGEAKFDIIANAAGESLTYEHFENKTAAPVVYTFKRTGICAMGVAESNQVTVKVLPEPFMASSYTFDPCPVAIPHRWTGLKYEWNVNGFPDFLVSEENNSALVSNLYKDGKYTLEVRWEQCPDVFTVDIQVSNVTVLASARTWGYTGKEQCIVLPPGKYKMEAWGAKGGNASSWKGGTKSGGYGGYASGEIRLTKSQMFYLYVGNAGVPNGGKTYNGGGGGRSSGGDDPSGGAGGGAADIRLEGGVWNTFISLKSRIIVAAGGAGADGYTYGSNGGAGGGLVGYNGNFCRYDGNTTFYVATGGTQIKGGTYGSSSPNVVNGVLGIGGNPRSKYGSGGGGGYYGGGGAAEAWHVVGSGAGGSSFISGHSGCDAISATSTSSSIIHTGQAVHYSGFYFSNTVMIDGAGYQWTTSKGSYVGMPNLAGTGTMTGNTGHGQVRITPVN
ncbi:MAG: glycine-rich protein, partial [Oscillibacter sp.]|nr:glycine-rich protein [Oscillibacter sp.]